ncbi:MAG: DUF6340 family protein [Dysgonomonas sp.]
MKYIFSTIITIFLLASCGTSTNLLTISVRNPATITFPPEVTKIVIVDNSPLPKEDNDHDHDHNDRSKAGEPSILNVDSSRTLLLKSLKQFMSEESYFNKVELYPYRTNGNTAETVVPLSKRKVQAICIERGADALIALDLFTISAQIETENTGYFSNYSILATKLGLLVRAYSNIGIQYGKPIVQLDSLFREESTDWSRLKSNVPEINSLITEMSVVGADKLTGKFIPSWQTQNRWYYSDRSAKMKETDKLVKQSKWEEAASIWNDLYQQEKNTKKKIRLAFNIALANEYLDDTENALNWIKSAYDLLRGKSEDDLSQQVMKYKQILEKRENAMPVLYKQLGIEEIPESEDTE